ncbi:MAG: hypothetical protein KatS3mg102_2338 [Planctomycetota bacterium]|nr:MAG: hypothetical protein KatS3mg102_2338 [Planctomycetota bacterium]
MLGRLLALVRPRLGRARRPRPGPAVLLALALPLGSTGLSLCLCGEHHHETAPAGARGTPCADCIHAGDGAEQSRAGSRLRAPSHPRFELPACACIPVQLVLFSERGHDGSTRCAWQLQAARAAPAGGLLRWRAPGVAAALHSRSPPRRCAGPTLFDLGVLLRI